MKFMTFDSICAKCHTVPNTMATQSRITLNDRSASIPSDLNTDR